MFFGASPKLFEKAKELRNNMTPAEKIMWEKLNRKQLMGYKFRRQHPIDSFIADFYCHAAKLVIEVDGKIHESSEQKEHDSGRDFQLKELGLNILRFSNEEVINDIEKVLKVISADLRGIPLNPLKGT